MWVESCPPRGGEPGATGEIGVIGHVGKHSPRGQLRRDGHRVRLVVFDGDAAAFTKQPGSGAYHMRDHGEAVGTGEDGGGRVI